MVSITANQTKKVTKFMQLILHYGITKIHTDILELLQPDEVVLSTNLFFKFNVSLPLVTGDGRCYQ